MTDERSLRSGWRRVRFGDVVRQVKETTQDPQGDGLTRIVGLGNLDSESLPVRRWDEFEELPDGTSFTRVFRAGQVLFGKRRAYQRKVAVPDFDGVCSGDILVFEPKAEDVLPGFLPYVIQSEPFLGHALDTSAGSLSPRTRWQDLAKYSFELPPVEEQRRIIDAISAVDCALDRYESVVAATQGVTEAVAAELLKVFGEDTVKLCDVAAVQYGLTVNPRRRRSEVKVPYLRVANVHRGSLDLEEVKEIGHLPGDDKYVLADGDVLVVEGHANIDEIGRAALWRGDESEVLHQNHLIRVRCSASLRPRVALALLNSSHGVAYFKSLAKSTSGLNTLNSTVVREFPMPVVDADPQASAEAILDAADEMLAMAENCLDRARVMRRAVLTSVLEGSHHVR